VNCLAWLPGNRERFILRPNITGGNTGNLFLFAPFGAQLSTETGIVNTDYLVQNIKAIANYGNWLHYQ
jgi:hypothetical protein